MHYAWVILYLYSYVALISSLLGSAGFAIMGFIFDYSGFYMPALYVNLLTYILALLLFSIIYVTKHHGAKAKGFQTV